MVSTPAMRAACSAALAAKSAITANSLFCPQRTLYTIIKLLPCRERARVHGERRWRQLVALALGHRPGRFQDR